ncbi:SDR family NAD(P)-dependent oxidoreductase [Nocardia arthritidis]|uniref:SDR family oxidoreductase n=1 Tax=Nocardia arthritidis TaxID=228602 RepID=A0A6G9YAA5_9NOCA|nr:SDR family oxidoreductase [Nocardia arthritidis]QIS10050.1 SDR family oxidoreductase [Nocardia arthritidis]
MRNETLTGKIALITGASRGIGAAIAVELATCGSDIAVNYRSSEAEAASVAREITALGRRALPSRADVTDGDQVKAMVAHAERELGPLDVLVLNTSGSSGVPRGAMMSLEPEELIHHMAVQVRAALLPIYAVVPGMIERGGGAIVFVSDPFARAPREGTIGHALARAPIEAVAKTLAQELGPQGVRVNVVIPGVTRTPSLDWAAKGAFDSMAARIPLRRLGEPEDIARAVAMLASDELSYVTGAFLSVSGGSLIL